MKNDEYRIKEYNNKFVVQRFYKYETSIVWRLLPLKVWFKAYYTPWFKEPVKVYREVLKNGEFKYEYTPSATFILPMVQQLYAEPAIFNTKKEALDLIDVLDFMSKSQLAIPTPIYHTVND